MKLKIMVGLFLTAGSFQALAANGVIVFSGAIQNDNAPAMAFDLAVPVGKTTTLKLEDGTTVEFSAAAAQGEPSQSVVTLLAPSGVKLHSTTRPGNTQADKSLFYLVCGGKVTYISPAPVVQPSCPQGEA